MAEQTLESPASLHTLLQILQPLDQLLEQAIAHIQQPDLEGVTSSPPASLPADQIQPETPLGWLQQTFGLSPFDLNTIAIALAPELDRRYETLYATLQNDNRYRRPTVDLVLNLLCPTATERLSRRIHFDSQAPLLKHQLMDLIPDPAQVQPTLLAHSLKLDAQVLRLLLEQPGLDDYLAKHCQLTWLTPPSETITLSPDLLEPLTQLVTEDWTAGTPLTLYFQGTDRPKKRHTAAALASTLNVPLLTTDLAQLLDTPNTLISTLKSLFRAAWFQATLLYIDNLDTLHTPEHSRLYPQLLPILAHHPGITILSGTQPWQPSADSLLNSLPITFPPLTTHQRRTHWQTQLAAANLSIDPAALTTLSTRFRLTPTQITNTLLQTQTRTRLLSHSHSPTPPLPHSLHTIACAQTPILPTLARRLSPKHTWDDLILPPTQKTQLREICNQAKYHHLVWEEWGFEDKLSLGRGLTVLFSGLPGTGKTMAAGVIAKELQLDLYQIDLSQIISKYIGETEKNLNRIFTAAANANAILLFDEADALFGKRSDVKDAHDRYANIEVGYLLQKMEEYEGVAILTTNLRDSLDKAFVRRLRFIVEFPFPNYEQRYQIWSQIWPQATKCSPDLDLVMLARKCELAGGNIRNIALAAAFLAADDGGMVGMDHVIRAAQREYQKMGKVLMGKELAQWS